MVFSGSDRTETDKLCWDYVNWSKTAIKFVFYISFQFYRGCFLKSQNFSCFSDCLEPTMHGFGSDLNRNRTIASWLIHSGTRTGPAWPTVPISNRRSDSSFGSVPVLNYSNRIYIGDGSNGIIILRW